MNRPDSFSPLLFRLYASDLSEAIFQMAAMNDLRDILRHLPGSQDLTMQYGDGGKTEIYTMGDLVKEFPAGTGKNEVAAAFDTPTANLANPFDIPKKKLSH